MEKQREIMHNNYGNYQSGENDSSGPSRTATMEFQKFKFKLPGVMTPKDLQATFENVGKHFSESSCKFIVRLFDLDKKGGLDINEFENLYVHVRTWVDAFNSFDIHRRGYLDEKELDRALQHMNITFTNDFIKYLLAKCDDAGKKITLDKFIIICIQIQKYSDVFNNLKNNSGIGNLNYGHFLESIMKCL